MPKVKSEKGETAVVEAKGKPVARVTQQTEIREKVLKLMKKGKHYTSREVVQGIGREPGSKGGDPVIRVLKKLVEEGVLAYGSSENYRGNVWTRK